MSKFWKGSRYVGREDIKSSVWGNVISFIIALVAIWRAFVMVINTDHDITGKIIQAIVFILPAIFCVLIYLSSVRDDISHIRSGKLRLVSNNHIGHFYAYVFMITIIVYSF